MSAPPHPAKQCNNMRPSDVSVSAKLGDLSSCAGQQAVHFDAPDDLTLSRRPSILSMCILESPVRVGRFDGVALREPPLRLCRAATSEYYPLFLKEYTVFK